jgi:hypothetical protein
MRTDGRTDMKKLIVAFRNFAKALKIIPEEQAAKVLNSLLMYNMRQRWLFEHLQRKYN